jgi:regulatory protein
LSPEERADPARLRLTALRLLARRDYAQGELRATLVARGFEAAAVTGLVGELSAEGLLNEARFAENYVSWHAARGQGPVRIASELRRAGVPEALIESALGAGADWDALARKVRAGKFGGQPPRDFRERARQARFLQYRGFSADHIRAATGADPDTD